MGMESATATPPRPSGAHASSAATPFASCVQQVRRLHVALSGLERQAALLQVAPLAGREWHELLTRKLLPQLGEDPFIVVAVVGGTNLGKSVIFNHLAGTRASSTSPLASGTKHPVCLVPAGFTERHDLHSIFPGFELESWTTSDAALGLATQDRLYWKPNPLGASNLLILDTPDIDSDAEVNWIRADHIRHCADVLIAVLTQQKYNDAAVKQFFRKAAAEDKAVVVIFNQCLLPDDEQYWPLWLQTFSRETGVKPELLYVAPNDRKAAEENRLPFYLRHWPEPEPRPASTPGQPRKLTEDLSQLHFDEIKLRTFRGSLRQILDHHAGVPAFLRELQLRSSDFEAAAQLMTSRQVARIQNWPAIPNALLVREVRNWWRGQREGWTRTIHDAYNTIGEGVGRSFRWARQRISGPEPEPFEAYQRQEQQVILSALENLYEGLSNLSQLGNELLRPRLEKILGGAARARLLEQVGRAHAELNLELELREVVRQQMQQFRQDSPQLYEFLKTLDKVAAGARPMTSVVLFFAGGIPVADAVVAPLFTEAVLHIAGGTGAVIVGETALARTAGGLRTIEARFQQLQTAFTVHRLSWFAEQVKANLLGSLQEELESAAGLPRSADFLEVQACLEALAKQAGSEAAATLAT